MGGSIQKAFHTVGRKMDEMTHKIQNSGQGPSPPAVTPGRGRDNWRKVAPPTQPGKESKEPFPVRAMPSGKGGDGLPGMPPHRESYFPVGSMPVQSMPVQPCLSNPAYPSTLAQANPPLGRMSTAPGRGVHGGPHLGGPPAPKATTVTLHRPPAVPTSSTTSPPEAQTPECPPAGGPAMQRPPLAVGPKQGGGAPRLEFLWNF